MVFFLFPAVGEKIPEGVRGSARPVSLALEKATSSVPFVSAAKLIGLEQTC